MIFQLEVVRSFICNIDITELTILNEQQSIYRPWTVTVLPPNPTWLIES